jgi:hypothetical protein
VCARLGVERLETGGANICALLGDADTALAAMHRAHVDLAANNTGDVWFPIYKSLRPDPRFKNLLRDLGVVDYWRETGSWGDYCRPVGGDNFECH